MTIKVLVVYDEPLAREGVILRLQQQQDMQVIADGPRFSHSGAAIVGKASEDEVGLQTAANLADRMMQALKNKER